MGTPSLHGVSEHCFEQDIKQNKQMINVSSFIAGKLKYFGFGRLCIKAKIQTPYSITDGVNQAE